MNVVVFLTYISLVSDIMYVKAKVNTVSDGCRCMILCERARDHEKPKIFRDFAEAILHMINGARGRR